MDLASGRQSRNEPGSRARKVNRTTSTVLRVLGEFLHDPGSGFRVSEVCASLGISKQTVVRCLQTLAREGYIIRRAQGAGYELGYRVIELGGFEQAEPDLQEIAASTMQRMHELCGETVSLAARVGDHLVLLEFIDGRWPLSGRMRRGHVMNLNIGPSSRTVLAFLSDSEIEDFIARHSPLPAVTVNAITDVDSLWMNIRSTREQGYGAGEVLPGVYSLGFPIFGTDDRPHGTVALVGRTEDLTGPRVQTHLGTLIELVQELNDQTRLIHAGPRFKIGL